MDLAGAIDLHVHTAPDIVARSMDDRELVSAAAAAGYAAVVLKSHVESTVGRARLASSKQLAVHGGVVLNQHCTGGINPAAVEACLRSGGRIIWLPTFSAADARGHGPVGSWFGRVRGDGVRVLVDGRLVPELHEVLDLVAQHDAVLATGHVCGAALLAVVVAAADHGVHRVLVQHPESTVTALSLDEQRALAGAHPDAVFERTLRSIATDIGAGRAVDPARLGPVLTAIDEFGPDRTVLSTDYGLAGVCDPVTAMQRFVDSLLAVGVATDAVTAMLCAVPRQLLGAC